jgi:hypothetical protein
MRLALLATVTLSVLIAAPAYARGRGQVDPPQRASTGRDYMTPGTEFHNDLRDIRGYGWTGRPVYSDAWYGRRDGYDYGNVLYPRQRHHGYRQPGLSIRYNSGNWSAQYSSSSNSYGGWNTHDGCNPYGTGWIQDSYYLGSRPVYVFGAPAAFDYGVLTPRYGGPLYTAPGNPDYGYTGGEYGNRDDDYSYGDTTAPQVYNDNRVINNYYGSTPGQQPAAPAQPAAVIPPAVPEQPANQTPSAGRPLGQRFAETVKLSTPDGQYMFAIRDGAIYAGLADGKPTRLSTEADADFGGYAAWLPGSGPCVFYRVGNQFCLGRPATDGRWSHEPLAYSVQFGNDTTIGLVGGMPWLVFSTTDGKRYVVRYTGNGCEEVGSGSR